MLKAITSAPSSATAAPLQISHTPRLGDIRLVASVAPDAPRGHIDVLVGLGRGSKGRGQRIGDDPAAHVAAVREVALHLWRYARDYEAAARADQDA
jgi:hypothetical protein